MTITKRKRLVIERDGKCAQCGSTENLTIDHIVPLVKGGTNAPLNLQTLCKKCNFKKADRFDWHLWERIVMALHIEEHISNFRNEVKSLIITSLDTARAKIISELQSKIDKLQNVVNIQSGTMIEMKERIKALEAYLKIQYVSETIQIKEYKKIK